jgi:hypothetical protein
LTQRAIPEKGRFLATSVLVKFILKCVKGKELQREGRLSQKGKSWKMKKTKEKVEAENPPRYGRTGG